MFHLQSVAVKQSVLFMMSQSRLHCCSKTFHMQSVSASQPPCVSWRYLQAFLHVLSTHKHIDDEAHFAVSWFCVKVGYSAANLSPQNCMHEPSVTERSHMHHGSASQVVELVY